MKDLSSIDFKDNVRFVVRRELKALGIKVPKNKVTKDKVQSTDISNEGVFGNSLDRVLSVNVGEEFYCSVPKFLVDATKYLENHLGTEGLFRKSGSIQRQKSLKQKIEDGESISDVQAHDVASLLKQFFRQLPEPLLTNRFSDCFLKSQRLECENSCAQATLYLCLLLPLSHLHTLQFLMRFAAKVALQVDDSKMGISNLAIVFAPNLMSNPKKENCNSSEKLLKDQTSVVDTLLKNSTQIGLVPDDVFEKAKVIGKDDMDGLTSSGDELEDNHIRRGSTRMSRPRTKSITGFVSGLGHRWKNSSNKAPGITRNTHRRSRSVKADLLRNKERAHREYENEEKVIAIKGDEELEHFVTLCKERKSMRQQNKRKSPTQERNNVNALSPATKKRTLLRELELNGISHPTRIVSASTQMFTTPTKRLKPTQPLADVVKKEYAELLLSGETQHVKVVDTMNYVPSPERACVDRTRATSNTRSPYDNVFESPTATVGDPVRPKPRNGSRLSKDVPASPYDNMFETPVSAVEPVRPQRRKITRRHSSGATRCFSSSPRQRPSIHQEMPVIKKTMEHSHISVAAELIQHSKRSSRVIYTGSAERKQSGKRAVNSTMTPCKYHKETPPAPVPKLIQTELTGGLIDTEL